MSPSSASETAVGRPTSLPQSRVPLVRHLRSAVARVLAVCGATIGLDVAVELSRFAKQVDAVGGDAVIA